ncbi:MAG: hypothetical protein OZ921_13680 [Sorangiineae bacterium]|nr:hypothetical protein [Polyangiaceae bacterium]MEB2323557.1 hypothetical protein [Sorangiineae bacterium]
MRLESRRPLPSFLSGFRGASALVALALGFSACVVPASRYDDARSALRLERDANRHAMERVYAMEREVRALGEALDQRQRALEGRDEQLAQSELDMTLASRKEKDATQRVDQLRGELARVGEHLRFFASQKEELERALDAAEARIAHLYQAEREAARSALVVRDLSLLLHDELATGELTLELAEGEPVLRAPRARLFGEDGALAPGAQPLVAALARAGRLHPGARVTLAERGSAPSATPEQSALRLGRLSAALASAGLSASQVTIAAPGARDEAGAPEPAQGSEPSVEIVFAADSAEPTDVAGLVAAPDAATAPGAS